MTAIKFGDLRVKTIEKKEIMSDKGDELKWNYTLVPHNEEEGVVIRITSSDELDLEQNEPVGADFKKTQTKVTDHGKEDSD